MVLFEVPPINLNDANYIMATVNINITPEHHMYLILLFWQKITVTVQYLLGVWDSELNCNGDSDTNILMVILGWNNADLIVFQRKASIPP